MRLLMASSMLFLAVNLHAQDFEHFDAAAIRPSSADGTTPPILDGGPGGKTPGRINYYGAPLLLLITRAYGLRDFQLPKSALPRYDITATYPAAATEAQFNAMLRNLITDRFHLKFHYESRDVPVYVLTVGPKGPKFKASAQFHGDPPKGRLVKPDEEGFPTLPPGFKAAVAQPCNGHLRLSAQREPLSQLTYWLQFSVDRPIIDQTGLTGDYDFRIDLEWNTTGPCTLAEDIANAGPARSVSNAVDHDLGLKLENATAPFDVMIIDHIDSEPTPN